MNIQNFLFLSGAVIFLGLLGQYLFRITRIPVPIWLIATGLLLGVFNPLDRDLLFGLAPYFGVVALLLILFEGGWELEIGGLLRSFRAAFLLGFFYFLLCWAGTLLIALEILRFPLSSSLMLAFALAGLSPSVVAPLLNEWSLSRKQRNFFIMESTLGEILTVLGSLALMAVLRDGPQASRFSSFSAYFLGSLGTSLALSFLAGLLWNRLMAAFGREPLAYMFTLALLCILYGVTDALGGEGSLSVLCFGFLLGNARWFSHRFSPLFNNFFSNGWRQKHIWLSRIIHKINGELAFLVRTFFFVFLGFAFDPSSVSPALLAAMLSILVLYFLARLVCSRVLNLYAPAHPGLPEAANLALVPRGLANAVVMFLALGNGIARSNEMLVLVLGTILGTHLLSAVLAHRFSGKNRRELPSPIPVPKAASLGSTLINSKKGRLKEKSPEPFVTRL